MRWGQDNAEYTVKPDQVLIDNIHRTAHVDLRNEWYNELSRWLVRTLRHRTRFFHLVPDEQGWVKLRDVAYAYRREKVRRSEEYNLSDIDFLVTLYLQRGSTEM